MRANSIFVLFLLSACGSSDPLSSSYQAIINGDQCNEQQFPASLELIKTSEKTYNALCGATLIAPDIAITAAHCVEDFMKSQTSRNTRYYVTHKSDLRTVYDYELSPNSRTMIPVHAVVMHGSYDGVHGSGPNHDIALLFLSRQSSVPPAQLISPEEVDLLRPGLTAYIVGWGQQIIAAKETVNSPALKHCASSFVNEINSWEMQLGSSEYSAHKCYGDSGGATYVQFEATALGAAPPLRLAGITSHGKANDLDCRKGGFDTRIDAYYDWIQGVIRDGCIQGFRLFCQ